jgi:hypothetical protein
LTLEQRWEGARQHYRRAQELDPSSRVTKARLDQVEALIAKAESTTRTRDADRAPEVTSANAATPARAATSQYRPPQVSGDSLLLRTATYVAPPPLSDVSRAQRSPCQGGATEVARGAQYEGARSAEQLTASSPDDQLGRPLLEVDTRALAPVASPVSATPLPPPRSITSASTSRPTEKDPPDGPTDGSRAAVRPTTSRLMETPSPRAPAALVRPAPSDGSKIGLRVVQAQAANQAPEPPPRLTTPD